MMAYRNPWLVLVLSIGLISCDSSPWNNPYPARESGQNILYGSFAERPKHLDPVSSYSSDENIFVAQIYEPPLQYHYLKRPYELTPLTAAAIPTPTYLDSSGAPLPADAPLEKIASSVYRITIRPGIVFQPHPALARDGDGRYLYHALGEEDLASIRTLADFSQTGTRELTAADYVYQLKRMVHPQLHSPIAGLMSEYILGM
ncbi:MAG: peptide ABC transporter substrate-binding protein, partial [Gammaproteobacteria bacterium]|nr:peptide ABC transporter substrate-binding protein [Gammaproteobacteria bacterium]